MSPASALFSALALLPAIGGPLPDLVRGGAIVASLCSGGTVTVPPGQPGIPRGDAPCCAKGCHTGERRRRFDSKQ